MYYIAHYNSPLGPMTLASNGEKLVGLWFDGQKHYGHGIDKVVETDGRQDIFCYTWQWLETYFRGVEPQFVPPIVLQGSDFRQRVWKTLLDIPYGRTATYGEIAQRIGCRSSRAVGAAIGYNPISLIIPCHRVVASSGHLTGYAGGIERKRRLLEIEQGQI